MTVAFDPDNLVSSMRRAGFDAVGRTLFTTRFWLTQFFFLLISIFGHLFLPTPTAILIHDHVDWAAWWIAFLYTFMLGWFCDRCYERYHYNWHTSMLGWSRLNDLALQIFAYVPDREQALDVLRLIHAANHLCWGDFALQDMLPVAKRRHLLTDEEIMMLRRQPAAPMFYQCASWALERLADPHARQPVERMLLLVLDRSVCQWREQTTLLPLFQQWPLPFSYIGAMLALSYARRGVEPQPLADFPASPLKDKCSSLAGERFAFDIFAAVKIVSLSASLRSAEHAYTDLKDYEASGGGRRLQAMMGAGVSRLITSPDMDTDEGSGGIEIYDEDHLGIMAVFIIMDLGFYFLMVRRHPRLRTRCPIYPLSQPITAGPATALRSPPHPHPYAAAATRVRPTDAHLAHAHRHGVAYHVAVWGRPRGPPRRRVHSARLGGPPQSLLAPVAIRDQEARNGGLERGVITFGLTQRCRSDVPQSPGHRRRVEESHVPSAVGARGRRSARSLRAFGHDATQASRSGQLPPLGRGHREALRGGQPHEEPVDIAEPLGRSDCPTCGGRLAGTSRRQAHHEELQITDGAELALCQERRHCSEPKEPQRHQWIGD